MPASAPGRRVGHHRPVFLERRPGLLELVLVHLGRNEDRALADAPGFRALPFRLDHVADRVARGAAAAVPLRRVGDSDEAHPSAVETATADAAPSTLRVLAAEDNSVNQLVLKTLLAQIGVEPVTVSNGREAVDAWEAHPWDLILMDVQMPEMDGLTATSLIRQREAETGRPRTPIIALSAHALSTDEEKALAAGADAYHTKPVELPLLLEQMERLLGANGAA